MTGRERQAAVDMTRGSPVKLILRFTLPLLIGQMMQQIYTLTDTMITGHFIGDAAIAAIGASTSLNDLMINFANGMCNGCGIIIGQLYGAQKMDKLRRATAVMLMFGVGLGALLTLGVMIGIEPLMRLLNTPESVFDEAMRYAAVVCGGVGVTILYNMCASFMRSLGNGRMPLVFLTISCVLNIALDTLFVVVLHIGVVGTALATLIVIWVVLATLCSLFVPLVFNKIYQLSNVDFATVVASIEEPIARAQSYLHEFFAMPESTFSLSEALASALKQVIDIESLNTVFASIVNVVLSSVIAIFSITFITFFFLRDEGLFYAMITAMFPERYHENITRALDSVTLLLARYFTGILSESLLLMVAVSLTMMAFGMKAADAAFIGLVMGVMNVVPYAGPLIGGVVSVFVGIVTPIGGMTVGHTAAVIIGSLLILKGLDDFVLQPTLYSSRVKAHPLEIFLVILIAGSLAGILGMLLAIPSYTVLRVFAKEFFSQFSLVRKLTEKI